MYFQFVALAILGTLPVYANQCEDGVVPKVRSKMLEVISHSWEYGVATQAILELEEPDISVFGEQPFPLSRSVAQSSPVVTISQKIMSTWQANLDVKPLVDDDDTFGDPASMGIAVLLAAKALNSGGYMLAVTQQLQYLRTVAPRAGNGAISHRVGQVQLWASFMYMAPPFIAYYGASYNQIDLLREAHNQARAYREVLRDSGNPSTPLWRHIMMGEGEDLSHWGTANAWAAAGMVRVLQTIVKSSKYQELLSETDELATWTKEILSASWGWQKGDGVLDNRPDKADFPDASWTALLAATTYRYAVLTGDESMVVHANQAMIYVCKHISDDGVLANTVDPLHIGQQTQPGVASPEGQAFVLLLSAAERDYSKWKAANRPPTMHGPKRASRMFARDVDPRFVY